MMTKVQNNVAIFENEENWIVTKPKNTLMLFIFSFYEQPINDARNMLFNYACLFHHIEPDFFLH